MKSSNSLNNDVNQALEKMTRTPPTVTLQQAADALDVTIYWVHRFIKQGKLKAWVVGGDIVVTRESVNQLLMDGD